MKLISIIPTLHNRGRIAGFLAFGVLLLAGVIFFPVQTFAVTTEWFQAGRIIDDAVFTNKNAMPVNQIQDFLNSKVPSCDTNGTQTSEFGGPDLNGDGRVQRWEWGQANYNQTTFSCLRNFSENGKSAAQIIFDISQQYVLNPQTLIVLLQKEQGLVTDTWPLNIQYRSATGYGCPDTAACDSEYYGFTNQVKWAATMFRAILNDSPTWYTPYELGNNYIQYNPNASCGGSNVNIENRATQALYNYTPYQPSQAALDANWGTVNCGAYGNRNFYLYFKDWFGSTIGPDNYWALGSIDVFSDEQLTKPVRTNGNEIFLSPLQTAFVKVSAQNAGRTTWQKNSTRLGTYSPIDYPSPFADSSWLANYRIASFIQDTVKPYETATFRFQIKAPSNPSFYTERYNLVTEGITWFNDANLRLYVTVQTPPDSSMLPQSTTPLTAGQSMTSSNLLYSSDKSSALKLSSNGTLELYRNFNKVWSSNTYNSGGNRLVLQSDGNLVLYKDQTPVWSSNSALQDQTGLVARKLPANSTMHPGQSLTTPDRNYHLDFQTDGNLVLYSKTKALWSSGTYQKNSAQAVIQLDGNLVISDFNDRAIWSSGTAGRGASELLLQQDANLVIYTTASSTPTWSSGTAGR
ncbi:MAG: Curculin protein [Candidatus Saccharibacteria bacterium]|nr:Curculin protein [Candidatus Saccharibacteria bacterium]